MATASYTIYSHYEPQEQGHSSEDVAAPDTSEPPSTGPDSNTWELDAFKPPPAPPPRFVPATLPAPDWDSGSSVKLAYKPTSVPENTEISSWYRSLTSSTSSTHHSSNRNTESLPSSLPLSNEKPPPKAVEKRDKNNWFIMNAIQSSPDAQDENVSLPSSPESLAAIIARDPPPLPSERSFKPPVWLEIGPSNKGFAILQRSGWNEGEPLGPDVARKPVLSSHVNMMKMDARPKGPIVMKREIVEVNVPGCDDVTEMREVDVIDLAASESEGDDEDDALPLSTSGEIGDDAQEPPSTSSGDHNGRTALLTPIPIVLKSDRLGIGLKAKTVGPYKASQKRVTHNAAAMAAHIRAAEESRRKRKMFGRGSRGFKVIQKKQENDRKHLLAYMNT